MWRAGWCEAASGCAHRVVYLPTCVCVRVLSAACPCVLLWHGLGCLLSFSLSAHLPICLCVRTFADSERQTEPEMLLCGVAAANARTKTSFVHLSRPLYPCVSLFLSLSSLSFSPILTETREEASSLFFFLASSLVVS